MTTTELPLRDQIRITLREADEFYTLMIEAGESPNIDRDGHTSHITLEVFRRLLRRPDLQSCELAKILRQARQIADRRLDLMETAASSARPIVRVPRPVQAPEPRGHDWSGVLMAEMIAASANRNYFDGHRSVAF